MHPPKGKKQLRALLGRAAKADVSLLSSFTKAQVNEDGTYGREKDVYQYF
jgi:hypothetical protein